MTGIRVVILLLQLLCAKGFLSLRTTYVQSREPNGIVSTWGSYTNRAPLVTSRLMSNDDEDDEDDDDYDVPDVDTRNFSPPSTLGRGGGRSAPSQRKAMSTKASSSTSVHVCTNCGSEFVKWMGRCPTCREWNTMQEFKVERSKSQAAPRPSFGGASSTFSTTSNTRSWLDGNYENPPMRVTDVYKQVQEQTSGSSRGRPTRIKVPNDEELNTVMGGGIMAGSLTLLGGDPGVGKSTLLLQTAGAVASLATPAVGIGMGRLDHESSYGPVWYVSGEENAQQIASRALRLGIQESELWLLAETHVDTLCEQVVASYDDTPSSVFDDDGDEMTQALLKPKAPSLIVIDSIQTMVCEAGGASSAGGVTQVRECVALFLRLAKSTGIPIFLVGHVTKSGDVAGPRTVEHMVDCVLYLEGGDHRTIGGVNLRMLRAAKNRFGSADEVGVYEMTTGRLMGVSDPSSLFLSNRIDTEDSEGCAISLIVEGLRAMTVEVQSLVTPCQDGPGRRTVNGIAYSRLQLLLGVLQKRCGMFFGRQDVYVNVVGNIRLDAAANEGSGSDLAVTMALVSSLLRIPVRSDTAFVGEVGLLGELRSVPVMEKRLQEARRMGFSRVVTPKQHEKKRKNDKRGVPSFTKVQGIDWIQCDDLVEALNEGLVTRLPKKRKRMQSKDSGNSPGSIEELMLNDADILVDEGDYDDHNFQ